MLTGESVPIEAGVGIQTYAGALVRRGEAVAEITATGVRTKFGRTAELVRTAHVVSSQQKAVLRVVRNLAAFNGVVIVLLVTYAYFLTMPLDEIIPLVLTAVLASIPVALPATFTLASALGARALAKLGVLPTRLSAVDEAATMNVLCADKTGTLTQNALTVTTVCPMPGFDEAHVLALGALASSDGGQDLCLSRSRYFAPVHVPRFRLLLSKIAINLRSIRAISAWRSSKLSCNGSSSSRSVFE
jgi:H+-transporting ATPase